MNSMNDRLTRRANAKEFLSEFAASLLAAPHKSAHLIDNYASLLALREEIIRTDDLLKDTDKGE